MFVSHAGQIQETPVSAPGAKGVVRQSLVGPPEGWEGWVMRRFKITAGGCTPRHSHPWPHINYILKGEGLLYLDGWDHPLSEGSIAYVPSEAEHQFSCAGEPGLEFICIVPEEGNK